MEFVTYIYFEFVTCLRVTHVTCIVEPVSHDPLMAQTQLIHTCDKTHLCVIPQDSSVCVLLMCVYVCVCVCVVQNKKEKAYYCCARKPDCNHMFIAILFSSNFNRVHRQKNRGI